MQISIDLRSKTGGLKRVLPPSRRLSVAKHQVAGTALDAMASLKSSDTTPFEKSCGGTRRDNSPTVPNGNKSEELANPQARI